MKLLFDQNLSYRLVADLVGDFAGSAHVRDFGLQAAVDQAVWNYAAVHSFVLISKDVDFQQRAMLLGPPPKVIWLRLGNCPTSEIASILRRHRIMLEEFEIDPAASFVALG